MTSRRCRTGLRPCHHSRTAVFPPDRQPSSSPINNWGDAQITLHGSAGSRVQWRISGRPYQYDGIHPYRTGKPDALASQRAKALLQTDTVAASKKWDTQNTYETVPADGSERKISSLGPEHSVKLANPGPTGPTGTTLARTQQTTAYDEGATGMTGPTGAVAYSLPTTTTVSANIWPTAR